MYLLISGETAYMRLNSGASFSITRIYPQFEKVGRSESFLFTCEPEVGAMKKEKKEKKCRRKREWS